MRATRWVNDQQALCRRAWCRNRSPRRPLWPFAVQRRRPFRGAFTSHGRSRVLRGRPKTNPMLASSHHARTARHSAFRRRAPESRSRGGARGSVSRSTSLPPPTPPHRRRPDVGGRTARAPRARRKTSGSCPRNRAGTGLPDLRVPLACRGSTPPCAAARLRTGVQPIARCPAILEMRRRPDMVRGPARTVDGMVTRDHIVEVCEAVEAPARLAQRSS